MACLVNYLIWPLMIYDTNNVAVTHDLRFSLKKCNTNNTHYGINLDTLQIISK